MTHAVISAQWELYKVFKMEHTEEHKPSEELQNFMKLNGNLSVQDLAEVDPEDLLQYNGFSWQIMLEVLSFSEFDKLV